MFDLNIFLMNKYNLRKIVLGNYGPRTLFKAFPTNSILNKAVWMLFMSYAMVDCSNSLVISFRTSCIVFLIN